MIKQCRENCGMCCIIPSISAQIPGMPKGKPAFTPCIHLDNKKRCKLFGKPERPKVCSSIQPSEDMCGNSAENAKQLLTFLEKATAPAKILIVIFCISSFSLLAENQNLPKPPSLEEHGKKADAYISKAWNRMTACMNNSQFYFSVFWRSLTEDKKEAAKRDAESRINHAVNETKDKIKKTAKEIKDSF